MQWWRKYTFCVNSLVQCSRAIRAWVMESATKISSIPLEYLKRVCRQSTFLVIRDCVHFMTEFNFSEVEEGPFLLFYNSLHSVCIGNGPLLLPTHHCEEICNVGWKWNKKCCYFRFLVWNQSSLNFFLPAQFLTYRRTFLTGSPNLDTNLFMMLIDYNI